MYGGERCRGAVFGIHANGTAVGIVSRAEEIPELILVFDLVHGYGEDVFHGSLVVYAEVEGVVGL